MMDGCFKYKKLKMCLKVQLFFFKKYLLNIFSKLKVFPKAYQFFFQTFLGKKSYLYSKLDGNSSNY